MYADFIFCTEDRNSTIDDPRCAQYRYVRTFKWALLSEYRILHKRNPYWMSFARSLFMMTKCKHWECETLNSIFFYGDFIVYYFEGDLIMKLGLIMKGCLKFWFLWCIRTKHFEDLKELKDVIEMRGTAPGKWITGGLCSTVEMRTDWVLGSRLWWSGY